jgi:BlaI family penicillinase repressor
METAKKELGRLSRTEMQVMRTIWGMDNPVTVNKVLEIYEKERGWKISTLTTIMTRLMDKGFLAKELRGKVNYYSPALEEEEFKSRETQAFMSSVHSGSIKSFFAALAEADAVNGEDLADLREWLDSYEVPDDTSDDLMPEADVVSTYTDERREAEPFCN